MAKLRLSKREWDKINDILANPLFEDIDHIEVEETIGCPGLGYVLTLSFSYTINGVDGTFSTEITNEEHW